MESHHFPRHINWDFGTNSLHHGALQVGRRPGSPETGPKEQAKGERKTREQPKSEEAPLPIRENLIRDHSAGETFVLL